MTSKTTNKFSPEVRCGWRQLVADTLVVPHELMSLSKAPECLLVPSGSMTSRVDACEVSRREMLRFNLPVVERSFGLVESEGI